MNNRSFAICDVASNVIAKAFVRPTDRKNPIIMMKEAEMQKAFLELSIGLGSFTFWKDIVFSELSVKGSPVYPENLCGLGSVP